MQGDTVEVRVSWKAIASRISRLTIKQFRIEEEEKQTTLEVSIKVRELDGGRAG